MTGLDIEKDKIMEVACIITDSQLNIIAQHPEIVINQPSHVLDTMNEWCKKQHGMVSRKLYPYHLPLVNSQDCFFSRV